MNHYEIRLWDSQWVNVVNHPDVLAADNAVEAVAIAVRLTEQAMADNIKSGEWPPDREAA